MSGKLAIYVNRSDLSNHDRMADLFADLLSEKLVNLIIFIIKLSNFSIRNFTNSLCNTSQS